MPKFSTQSSRKLSTCHEDLIRVFVEVVKNFDCSVLEGNRALDRQQELIDSGMSHTMNSRHLSTPSEAFDVLPAAG